MRYIKFEITASFEDHNFSDGDKEELQDQVFELIESFAGTGGGGLVEVDEEGNKIG